MKIIGGIFLALVLAAAASAQDLPSTSLTRGTWDFGLFAGGGTGLGKSDNTQFFFAGGRVGRILTHDHLSGWARGNFEWAIDMMPLYAVLPPGSGVYGGSFKPAIWQWNFTSHKRIVPYVAAAGGIVFSTNDIPPGNTSPVNFTSQFVTGAHVFVKPGHGFFFEDAIGHLSSASLGRHNPGYNGLIEFTVGYSWFRGGSK